MTIFKKSSLDGHSQQQNIAIHPPKKQILLERHIICVGSPLNINIAQFATRKIPNAASNESSQAKGGQHDEMGDVQPMQVDQPDDSSLNLSSSDADEENQVKGGKPASEQEKRAAADISKCKKNQKNKFRNKLSHIMNKPEL